MTRRCWPSSAVLAGLAALWLGGCPPQVHPTAQNVIFAAAERLAPPQIPHNGRVFRLEQWVAIDAADPTGPQAASFGLRLETPVPDVLQLRFTNKDTTAAGLLTRVPPPSQAAERELACAGLVFRTDVRDLLATGGGVFWHNADGPNGETRLGVLIPAVALGDFNRLDLFTNATPEGAPLNPVTLDLVRNEFLYLAVLGDSVLWGNGLLEPDKIDVLVAGTLQRETRRYAISQRFAQSGAEIVPEPGDGVCETNCFGEAPIVSTNILLQADLIRRPDLLDLVLLDGCINDVGLTTILNPEVPPGDILALTEHFCRDEMAGLLRKVRARAPQARIFVTGYYSFIGPESNVAAIRAWEQAQGNPLPFDDSPLVAALVANAEAFAAGATLNLAAAADLVNAETGAAAITFVDPQFGPRNAVFAPEPWLWSLTADNMLSDELDTELPLFPEDPLVGVRSRACVEQPVVGSTLTCAYASVGHPNPAGARAYARAIVAALRNLGVLPAVTE